MKVIALIEIDEGQVKEYLESEGYDMERYIAKELMVEDYIASTLHTNAQYDSIGLKVKLVIEDCKLSDIL